MMAAHYKTIHPVKYYHDFLANDIRPDNRGLERFRAAMVNIGSISTADGSAIVKIGDTTVVCGIKAELVKPTTQVPDQGFLIPNVELPPLCSSKFRPGPPSDQAQVLSQLVADVVANSGCVNLRELCILSEHLVWVLYCDITCLNYDGAVADACVIALVAALRSVKLPRVVHNAETDTTTVTEEERTPLKIHSLPVATTYAIFDSDTLLTDPCAEEEDLSTGLITIAVTGDELCLVMKPGGAPLSQGHMDTCIGIARRRAQAINMLTEVALKQIK